MTSNALEGIEQQSIGLFTEQAYLNYSMYVIMDRALPHIGDGLKPVQRRIIYAMSELGLSNQSKYKKSARTIGDVLGKFHPHGDSACYEAMVLMAQPFSYRYPLVDGQGNWGSSDDPKSFAAMRYTEAKLAKYAAVLLDELGQGTVDWNPNFDGTLNEPKVLPARLPSLLLNGTTGIAVGMATDVPPHNLGEVVKACLHLLSHPKATLDDLLKFIKGPDFPAGGEIISPPEDIKKIYQSGVGTFRMRACYNKEDQDIVITSLPHQVSGSKILEQIAAQMQSKKLTLIQDLRDESDHESPTRLVITPKNAQVKTDELMGHLFASTDLERSYRVNMNVIGLNGRPMVKDLKTFLSEWLVYRRDTVKRRLHHRLEKVVARLHILDALMVAFLNIDEVIHIIRHEDKPKAILMKKFKLSETQAEAILDLKLRHLAKLEEVKIQAEQKSLSDERKSLELILNSEQRMTTLIKKELQADEKAFADDRRSPIVERTPAILLQARKQSSSDPLTVVLSEKGWCRQAKGHEVNGADLNYKSLDGFMQQVQTFSNKEVVFLDSLGRCYTTLASQFPSARSLGEPLSSLFKTPTGVEFIGMLSLDEKAQLLLVSSNGYGFVTKFSDLFSKNKSGKGVLSISKESRPLPFVTLLKGHTRIAMLTAAGKLLVCDLAEIPVMQKGKGNRLIQMTKSAKVQDCVIDVISLGAKDSLELISARKKVKLSPKDLDEYLGDKGSKAQALPKGSQKASKLSFIPNTRKSK